MPPSARTCSDSAQTLKACGQGHRRAVLMFWSRRQARSALLGGTSAVGMAGRDIVSAVLGRFALNIHTSCDRRLRRYHASFEPRTARRRSSVSTAPPPGPGGTRLQQDFTEQPLHFRDP
eukprot:3947762-Prymnesium_polylepis.1